MGMYGCECIPVDNFGTVVGENPTPYGILALWAVNGLSIVYWDAECILKQSSPDFQGHVWVGLLKITTELSSQPRFPENKLRRLKNFKKVSEKMFSSIIQICTEDVAVVVHGEIPVKTVKCQQKIASELIQDSVGPECIILVQDCFSVCTMPAGYIKIRPPPMHVSLNISAEGNVQEGYVFASYL